MKKNYVTLCLLAAFVIAGTAGCSTGDKVENQSGVTSETSASAQTPEKTGVLCGSTAEGLTAIDTIVRESQGVVIGIDRSDSDRNWEVKFVDDDKVFESEVSCDGKTITKTKDKGTLDADDKVKVKAIAVSIDDAVQSVNKKEGILDEAELDDKDGKIVWEISFDDSDGHDLVEVLVDVTSGKILR